jgi:hypothetical protein
MAEEHFIIRAGIVRGPEVIATVCIYDASLDILRV